VWLERESLELGCGGRKRMLKSGFWLGLELRMERPASRWSKLSNTFPEPGVSRQSKVNAEYEDMRRRV
jgi:hypothetical protein